MNISLSYVPLFLASSFAKTLFLKPGKADRSVRVVATNGHSLLEFFAPNALTGGTTFDAFGLNLTPVLKNYKPKLPKTRVSENISSYGISLLFDDNNQEIQVQTASGLCLSTKKEGVPYETDELWNILKRESEKEHQSGNIFAVPPASYELFSFEKWYPGMYPLFIRHGMMTLVKYPKETSFPYAVQGITMQRKYEEGEYDTECFPEWM